MNEGLLPLLDSSEDESELDNFPFTMPGLITMPSTGRRFTQWSKESASATEVSNPEFSPIRSHKRRSTMATTLTKTPTVDHSFLFKLRCDHCKAYIKPVESSIPTSAAWFDCGSMCLLGCWFGTCLFPLIDASYQLSQKSAANAEKL
ncbi:unnamed protein product [Blepharisma stoltei]|uniref:LITAF domain-containing protein n=1 Tax=Blepharisma stoltei TaxID=1481888 RepID=A0AAU9JDF0_9CILI|nr:unnamed protein product [Blepharisma stoltei]